MGFAGGKLPTAAVAAVAVLLALLVASCGGDDDGSTTSDSTTSAQEADSETGSIAAKEASTPEQSGGSQAGSDGSSSNKHDDSGGGSAQFKTKGGDNSVQEFGEEGSGSEFDQAAEAVHGFFDARVRGDWKTTCVYLAADVSQSLRKLAGDSEQLEEGGCAQTLEAISEGVPTSAFKEAAKADVGSLRIEGDRAFVIYRGAKDLVYAMPMQKEDGEWKVASLAGTPLS